MHYTCTGLLFLVILVSALLVPRASGGSPASRIDVRCDTVRCQLATVDPNFGQHAAFMINDGLFSVNGWNGVVVEADATFASQNPALAYYAAGFAEGYGTQADIHATWMNIMEPMVGPGNTGFNRAAFLATMQAHFAYLLSFNVSDPDPFNRQTACLMWMVQGMAAGYNASWIAAGSPPAQQRSMLDIFLQNIQPEIGDWMTATQNGAIAARQHRRGMATQQQQQQQASAAFRREPRFSGAGSDSWPSHVPYNFDTHCTVLVRDTGNDLLVAHTTWWQFRSMYRQLKTYRFEGTNVTMSSYPGLISSMDDFYTTSRGLVVTETTLWVFNTSLYQSFLRPNTIAEFLRVMGANFLADSASQWVTLFSTQNSGTYCNQYMAVDLKLYTPGQPIAPNTLWVAEQLPGRITAQDLSGVLQSQGYWASFNVPYYADVDQWSGDFDFRIKYGFTPDYGRRRIAAVQAPLIQDVAGMQRAIRYNNYLVDPDSIIPNCTGAINNVCSPTVARSAWFAIASRGDLVPYYSNATQALNAFGTNWPLFNGHGSGGTDGKISGHSLMFGRNQSARATVLAINGPTQSNGLPPFRWSNLPGAERPMEHPDLFNFSWVAYVQGAAPPQVVGQPAPVGDATGTNAKLPLELGLVFGVISVTALVTFFLVRHKPGARHAAEAKEEDGTRVTVVDEDRGTPAPSSTVDYVAMN